MKLTPLLLACASFCLAVTAHSDDKAPAATPRFDVRDAEIQKLLRAAIATRREGFRLMSVAVPSGETPSSRVAVQTTFATRPLRQPAAVECREFDCIAYDEKGKVLYTTPPPDPGPRIFTGTKQEWLSCQSGNNLLPTWERAEICSR
jgi:hypothetical protein